MQATITSIHKHTFFFYAFPTTDCVFESENYYCSASFSCVLCELSQNIGSVVVAASRVDDLRSVVLQVQGNERCICTVLWHLRPWVSSAFTNRSHVSDLTASVLFPCSVLYGILAPRMEEWRWDCRRGSDVRVALPLWLGGKTALNLGQIWE